MLFSASDYYTALESIPAPEEMPSLAERVFGQVFRGNFSAPGVALIGLGTAVSSFQIREGMVSLKEHLSLNFYRLTGQHLAYLSLGRFDQQDTTRFHLDGAPEESFLMLGYEPSRVHSELAIADYSRAACDLGIEPQRFLTEFNPLYAEGERRLAAYITPLRAFDPNCAQILLINNSSLPFRADGTNQQGVMHQATIPNPNPSESRIVNSTMICSSHQTETLSAKAAVQTFLQTTALSGRLYG